MCWPCYRAWLLEHPPEPYKNPRYHNFSPALWAKWWVRDAQDEQRLHLREGIEEFRARLEYAAQRLIKPK